LLARITGREETDDTLWQFNIAIENSPFIDEFPIAVKPPFIMDFPWLC